MKHGVGKDIYVAQNVIEMAIVSTSSSTSLGAMKSCIGLNKRTLRRGFYRRQVLDVKEEGEQLVKGDTRGWKNALSKG